MATYSNPNRWHIEMLGVLNRPGKHYEILVENPKGRKPMSFSTGFCNPEDDKKVCIAHREAWFLCRVLNAYDATRRARRARRRS